MSLHLTHISHMGMTHSSSFNLQKCTHTHTLISFIKRCGESQRYLCLYENVSVFLWAIPKCISRNNRNRAGLKWTAGWPPGYESSRCCVCASRLKWLKFCSNSEKCSTLKCFSCAQVDADRESHFVFRPGTAARDGHIIGLFSSRTADRPTYGGWRSK